MLEKIEQKIVILEARIVELQATVQQLRDTKAAVEARVLDASPAQKALCVEIHTAFCTKAHGGAPGDCTWNTTPNADDPALVDWTELAHVQWLASTQDAIEKAREFGFTVEEPVEP